MIYHRMKISLITNEISNINFNLSIYVEIFSISPYKRSWSVVGNTEQSNSLHEIVCKLSMCSEVYLYAHVCVSFEALGLYIFLN